jgi:hypothetical protein
VAKSAKEGNLFFISDGRILGDSDFVDGGGNKRGRPEFHRKMKSIDAAPLHPVRSKNMKLFIQSIPFIIMLFFGSVAFAEQTNVIRSPDGNFVAKITFVQKTSEVAPEISIEIKDATGKVTAKKDFISESGEHGLSLDKAAWTPDSQFFVFTTFSTGGHMAWQYPAFFFDRRNKIFRDFADFLQPIADGAFELKAPDVITITIWTPLTTVKPLDESIDLPITFRMSDLVKVKK